MTIIITYKNIFIIVLVLFHLASKYPNAIMADYMSAELAATCAALGYYDGKKYYLDEHCLGELLIDIS